MVVIQLPSFGSELKLRILKNGKFTVSIYNQTQTNNVNYFQFAGLTGCSYLLTVQDQFSHQTVFSNYVQIPEGTLVNAELDGNGTLNIRSTEQLFGSNPGNGNNSVGNVNYNGNHHGGNHHGYGNPQMNNNLYFQQFLVQLQNESFDSNRLNNALAYVSMNPVSTTQIREISKTFTFDSNRLDFAKRAYQSCYDKQNYFLLRDSFTFDSNYNSLMHYISHQ